MSSPTARSLNSAKQETFRTLLHDHIRKVETFCADCTAPINVESKPWASVNLGVLVCLKCSGVHRSLGVHVSQVRNVDLDKWDEDAVAAVTKKSNVQLNLQYEFHVPPDYLKPNENSPTDLRTRFIQAKYRDRLFEKKGHRKRQSAQIDLSVEQKDAQVDVGMVAYTGLVLIRLIEAKDLPSMDIGSESDPYVIFSNQSNTQKIKSATIDDNNNPVWNENLTLSVNGLDGPINISVFDADRFSKDDFIGKAEFDISELTDGSPHEYWIPLVDKKGKPLKKNARLRVELSYVPIL